MLSNIATITLEHVLEINSIVANESRNKGFTRTGQSWIGSNSPVKSSFVFPPPEYLNELLINWLDYMNNSNVSEECKAIFGHNQLIGIHPFSDGNGRTGRLFLQSTLERKYGEIIHPCLYRLNNKDDTYIEAIQSTLTAKGVSEPLHKFWSEGLEWSNKTKQKMYVILEKGQMAIASQLMMAPISEKATKLVNYLWAQPIVCEIGLIKNSIGLFLYLNQSFKS